MRIHYLQHVPFEGPAKIVQWAHEKGHALTGTHLYNYESVPDMDGFDCLVIMGGPMNIYEEESYPWLKYEKQFIKKAIDMSKAVLGICLGAQLIADVLGGEVTKNPEGEIGWLRVKFNAEAFKSPLFKHFPDEVYVFQWHNDTFSRLGEGAVCVAGSEACAHQAFIYRDRVAGLQFHIESTEDSIASLINNCADDMKGGAYVQTEGEIRSGMSFLKEANCLMDSLLERLAAYCPEQEQL